MAKYAIIQNNVVQNIIEWDGVSEFQPPDGTIMIPAEDAISVGSRAGAPGTIPDISDRQFFQQAAVMGLITQDEALQAVKVGAIPAALQSIVDAITDPNAKFAATMLLAGATVFQRDNALTNQVGVAMGWTSAQLDDFFLAAALL
jgi:hypothetical protein